LESVTVKTCELERPARMTTPIQFPAVLLEVKASDAVVVVPASRLAVCASLMLVTTVTLKGTALLATPPTVTTMLPVFAPAGTGTTIVVAPQLVGVAVAPLNVTVLLPWLDPKFAPAIVTEVPTGPEVGVTLVIMGAEVTVNTRGLLARPPTVTTTFPVVAPAGTGATMLVALQLVGVAVVPLNVTVLLPWLDPKFAPAIVTDVPTEPAVGLRPVIVGLITPPADLKAANTTPHASELVSVAVAEATPAAACI